MKKEIMNRNLITLLKNVFATAEISKLPSLWFHIVCSGKKLNELKLEESLIKENCIVVKKLESKTIRLDIASSILPKLNNNTLVILNHSFKNMEVNKIMREVFDGHYQINTGYKILEWKGKINIISFSTKLPKKISDRVILLKI